MSNSEKLSNPERRTFIFGKGSVPEKNKIEPTLDLSMFEKDPQATELPPEPETKKVSVDTIASLPSLVHPKQIVNQLDQLIVYTKSLREKTGLKHLEAMNEKTEFYETRTKIRQLRSRIKKIKQGNETEEDVAEVQKLWQEMSASVLQLEGVMSQTQSVNVESNQSVPFTPEDDIKENQTASEGDELLENSKRKERLVLRNEWKEKKLQFEIENATYLQSEKVRREVQTKLGSLGEKFAFWKKENKPQSLLLAEQAYQSARKDYAMQLRFAVSERQGRKSGANPENNSVENDENITATFANRFVIAAAGDRAKQEELFVPTGKRSEVLKELRAGLRKHSRALKYGSLVAATGFAVVSGGFFAGANALLGRTLSAKLAAGGAVAGSYLGGYVGRVITESKEYKRNRSMKKAQTKFAVEQIDQFEAEYFERYKDFERAVKNEEKYIAGGAILGGLAGSALGGDLTEALEKLPYEQPSPVLDNLSQKGSLEAPSKQFSDRIAPSIEEQVSPKSDLEVRSKDSSRIAPTVLGDQVAPKVDSEPFIKDVERILEEPQGKTDLEQPIVSDLHYTFIPGDRISTVSEALCSMIENNPNLVDGDMSPGEAVRDFNHEIEHLKQDNPDYYYDLLDQMGVSSGNIDEVGAGKTYNFAPLFDYLNSLPQ